MSSNLHRNTLRLHFENQTRNHSSSRRSLHCQSLLHHPIALHPLPPLENHSRSTSRRALRMSHPPNKPTTKTHPKHQRQHPSDLQQTKASQKRSATLSLAFTVDLHRAPGVVMLESLVIAMSSYGACRNDGGESRI